jgi:hypothetical protein
MYLLVLFVLLVGAHDVYGTCDPNGPRETCIITNETEFNLYVAPYLNVNRMAYNIPVVLVANNTDTLQFKLEPQDRRHVPQNVDIRVSDSTGKTLNVTVTSESTYPTYSYIHYITISNNIHSDLFVTMHADYFYGRCRGELQIIAIMCHHNIIDYRGKYVFANLTPTTQPTGNNQTVIIIFAIGMPVAIIGFIVIGLLMKKRKYVNIQ